MKEHIIRKYRQSNIKQQVKELTAQNYVVVVAHFRDGERFQIMSKHETKGQAWRTIGSKRNCFIVERG